MSRVRRTEKRRSESRRTEVRTKGGPEREGGASARGSWEEARCKEPLRAFGLTPLGMLVGGFRDPEAAFAAAQGLEFYEPIRCRNGPRKAQGPAATRASRVKHGDVAGRLHRHRAHHRDISSAVSPATHGRGGTRRGGRADSARGGRDCRPLLRVPVTFCGKLGLKSRRPGRARRA